MRKKLLLPALIFNFSNSNILDETMDKISKTTEIIRHSGASKELSPRAMRQERFNNIWKQVKDKLVKGSKLYSKKELAPDKTYFFGDDKQDIQDDIDDVLNDIIEVLIDDDILKYKNDIEYINRKIEDDYEKISEYKESKIGAPEKSLMHTTKSGYEQKIKDTKDEIKILKNKIRMIKKSLKQKFAKIGVKLNAKQIDVLLTRVDGDDIIQMSVVINVLKQITKQILTLMKSSNEDLVQAKRYYGMHLVSVALIVNIQQKYINKLDKEYLPKLDALTQKAKKLMEQTEIAIDSEQDSNRKTLYASNLKAQKLTLNVATMYKQNLLQSREKVLQAKVIANRNLALAENTYNTVALSKGIYDLITESQTMFNKISQIQMPDIVPFENTQIESKYRELTKKILSK